MDEKEYLSVGQLAKKMNVSVRTLQYYDKQDLLNPSIKNEFGYRFYSKKDIVKLHQILSFKHLGFSLDEIKNKIFLLDDPKKVSIILKQQQAIIIEQINTLNQACESINLLNEEINKSNIVDFGMYADIIVMIKNGNKDYWVWKFFDEEIKEHIMDRFAKKPDLAKHILNEYKNILNEAIKLKACGESYTSDKSVALAKRWWDMILEFTGGDMSLIPKLEEFSKNKNNWDDNDMANKQVAVDEFIEKALNEYLKRTQLVQGGN